MCSNFVHLLWLSFQADPETDEVYAQMTLQPVFSVSTIYNTIYYCFNPYGIPNIELKYSFKCVLLAKIKAGTILLSS